MNEELAHVVETARGLRADHEGTTATERLLAEQVLLLAHYVGFLLVAVDALEKKEKNR